MSWKREGRREEGRGDRREGEEEEGLCSPIIQLKWKQVDFACSNNVGVTSRISVSTYQDLSNSSKHFFIILAKFYVYILITNIMQQIKKLN